MTTTDVENYPGFPQGILGPELVQAMKEQAMRFGTEIIAARAHRLTQTSDGFLISSEGKTYESKTVILATGATARRLGLDSEKKLYGHGVSACATCDGFFFRGKKVVVVGGGDSAMEEAMFLTKFAERVTIIHRRDVFRASAIMQERVKKHSKIEILWNTEVTDILGVDVGHVTGVQLCDVVTGEKREMIVDGVFAAIGHEPSTELVKDLLEMDERRYVKTRPGTSLTNVPGLFVAGDVQDPRYRQAITAAGSGCMAAIDAERYLENL